MVVLDHRLDSMILGVFSNLTGSLILCYCDFEAAAPGKPAPAVQAGSPKRSWRRTALPPEGSVPPQRNAAACPLGHAVAPHPSAAPRQGRGGGRDVYGAAWRPRGDARGRRRAAPAVPRRRAEEVPARRARRRHGAVSGGGEQRRARGAREPERRRFARGCVRVRENEVLSLREELSAVIHGITAWASLEGTTAIGHLVQPACPAGSVLEHVARDCVRTGLEYLQGGRLLSLFGQSEYSSVCTRCPR